MADSTTNAPHRYLIKYIIVDEFGEILWHGRCTVGQDKPIPEGISEAHAFHALNTANVIRKSCDEVASPAGRVVVLAHIPLN